MKAAAAPVRIVDAYLSAITRTHADARLRADARGRDGGVRQELAAGVAPMTNHDDVPTPLPALAGAVIFCILLVAAVAIFTLVLIR
jgi:hypothetical protein